MLSELPWMQPSPQGKALDSGFKTPKTNVACTHCRRGVQRNVELYRTSETTSRKFFVQQLKTILA